jgi:uncharacterized protein YggE
MNKAVVMISLMVFLLLVAIRVFHISYPVDLRIAYSTQTSELSVVGEGKVDVVPDTAIIDAGISVSRAATAERAKTELSTVNNAIIAGLKRLGIKKEDIKTTSFNITPEYDYNLIPLNDRVGDPAVESLTPDKPIINPNPRSRIVGYNGSASVTVKIRNKDLVTQAIENVTQAGANNVSSERYVVDNPAKFREEARNKAIANAKEQAKKLAKELGIKLGRVTNFIESGGGYPYYASSDTLGFAPQQMGMKQSVAPELEEGTQTVTSHVTLFFEKE